MTQYTISAKGAQEALAAGLDLLQEAGEILVALDGVNYRDVPVALMRDFTDAVRLLEPIESILWNHVQDDTPLDEFSSATLGLSGVRT